MAPESGWKGGSELFTPNASSDSTGPSKVEGKNPEYDAWQASWNTHESVAASAAPARDFRPDADSCETIDPFDEPFDEEEVVLDSFATWDSANHRRSPRVENRRDRGFTALVQQALEASAAEAGELERDPMPAAPTNVESSVAQLEASHSTRSRVRLAVVSEPAPLKPIPVVTTPDAGKERGVAADQPALANRDGGRSPDLQPRRAC